jgi:hypothetical protein
MQQPVVMLGEKRDRYSSDIRSFHAICTPAAGWRLRTFAMQQGLLIQPTPQELTEAHYEACSLQ